MRAEIRMSTDKRAAAALAIGLSVAGCGAVSPKADFTEVQTMAGERIGQTLYWSEDGSQGAVRTEQLASIFREPLTAETAVRVALLNNRDLQATYQELGIARADLIQAGLPKNPVLSVERRFSGQALETDVMQNLLDLLVIPLRKRIAGAELAAAKSRVAQAAIDHAFEVEAAFYTLQGDLELVEMWRTVASASRASAIAARRMYEAGNITDLELRTEESGLSEAKLELATAEAETTQQRERLNVLMGVWGDASGWTIKPRLPDLGPPDPPLAGLESLAVSRRLDLAAAREEITARAQTLGFTRATRFIPDLEGGFHYEREPEGGDGTAGPSFDLTVPLFDQGRAATAKGTALLRQAQERYYAEAVEIRSAVRSAFASMTAARQKAEFHRRVALPLRAEVLRQSQLHYNAMQVGVLQLLEAKREQLHAGRSSVEALKDYWIARSALERAVGTKLDMRAAASPGEPARPADNSPHSSHSQAGAT
jgi:cobalt-zinc-cadmium efflux system outer membrane protein